VFVSAAILSLGMDALSQCCRPARVVFHKIEERS